MKKIFSTSPTLWLLLCLSLGLAPFKPEPHLWGKLKWIWGGAKGMVLMDWIDLCIHGFPFVFLALSIWHKVGRSDGNKS